MISANVKTKWLTPEQIFFVSAILVNGGNYLYNLLMGRFLGPEQFSDAAVLITFLLVISFMAMTFQLTVAKFIHDVDENHVGDFVGKIRKGAVLVSMLLSIVILFSANLLQDLFHTSSANMFRIFAIGIPVYFILSIHRGFYQGKKNFIQLSITYQSEMIIRLLATLILLGLFFQKGAEMIALGIFISLLAGLFPLPKRLTSSLNPKSNWGIDHKIVRRFFMVTAFYELTQIIINNSDILMVKHYFDAHEAGLYASLALIGRVVYFVAWMFVMVLLPTLVHQRKQGIDTSKTLFKYLSYIGLLAMTMIIGSRLFPNLIVQLMFGDAYTSIAPMLWKYALATSLFALSNVFVYFFLSLDKYVPVILSAIMGLSQVAAITLFHNSLEQVVWVQIILMVVLLLMQVSYFVYLNYFTTYRKQTTINRTKS